MLQSRSENLNTNCQKLHKLKPQRKRALNQQRAFGICGITPPNLINKSYVWSQQQKREDEQNNGWKTNSDLYIYTPPTENRRNLGNRFTEKIPVKRQHWRQQWVHDIIQYQTTSHILTQGNTNISTKVPAKIMVGVVAHTVNAALRRQKLKDSDFLRNIPLGEWANNVLKQGDDTKCC